MKIYIGADHRGFELKDKISKWLFENGYEFEDVGAMSFNKDDDYTKYASKVASLVANDNCSRGILLCGSGVGVDVVANKFDNVRSSIGKSVDQVTSGRRDDDMNILVIASDFTENKEALAMVEAFLKSKFSNEKRHQNRLDDIKKIEANN